MSLITQPTIKKVNEKETIAEQKSVYQPDKLILSRITDVISDFSIAQNFRDNNWVEFNGNTLDERASKDQEMFNGNTPEGSGDPNETWKANTVNPMVRNRCISIMAHLIQAYLYPSIVAQNDKDEEDKEASLVFGDVVEWALEQAKYSEKMMMMLYAFISEPIVCVKLDYVDAKRKIKDIQEDGTWKWKEIKDEEYGGFQLDIIPYDEIYFGNVHETDVQKQPFIVTRRIIDYTQAKIKYGNTPNFDKVSPGVYSFLNVEDSTFYDKEDIDDLSGQKVYEDIYFNRWADLELVFINGILVHNDPDRPMQRADKKYPFAETGYELIHNRFIYKKSLVSKLAAVQIDLNDLWNATKDMARYQATPATFSYGFEEMDGSVLIPGMNTNTQSKEAGIVPINNGSNLANAMNVISMLQTAQNEGSQAPAQSGMAEAGSKTKYEVQRLEANAQTVLGLSGEMLAKLVRQIGQLTIGLIVQHLPITEIGDITNDDAMLKMMPIVIPDRNVDGQKKTRRIEFTDQMPQNAEEEMSKSFEMLDEESNKGISLIRMNPELIDKLKFLVKVEPVFMDRQTKISKSIGVYDRLLANPMVAQHPELLKPITQDLLLGQLLPGEEYKYLPDSEQPIEQMAKQMVSQETKSTTPVQSQNQSLTPVTPQLS